MTAIETLATYAAELRWPELPAEVQAKTRKLVQDSVGCAVGGSVLAASRALAGMVKDWGGRREAQVMGLPQRAPKAHAAYINAGFANALDFDDTYLVIGHPGAAVIPTALAVGEALRRSGEEVLAAVVAGYEVSCRIGYAITPSLARMDQVFGLPTWHTWGAVSAAGRLMRLAPDRLADAMAVSGPHAMVPHVRKYGLEDRPVSWIKNNMGWCALGGVIAAELAARGYRGNRSFLDGRRGFWVMAGSDRCDFHALTDGLGERYCLLDVSYKPYPVCRYIHVAVDALWAAMGERRLQAEEIMEIAVHITSNAARDFAVRRPSDTIDAQYSLPYALAVAFLRLPPGPLWFDEALLTDRRVTSLADAVRFVVDPEADRAFAEQRMICTIELRLRSGEILRARRDFPRGDPLDPMMPAQLRIKFRDLCEPVLGSARTAELEAALGAIERLESIDILAPLLAPPAGRRAAAE